LLLDEEEEPPEPVADDAPPPMPPELDEAPPLGELLLIPPPLDDPLVPPLLDEDPPMPPPLEPLVPPALLDVSLGDVVDDEAALPGVVVSFFSVVVVVEELDAPGEVLLPGTTVVLDSFFSHADRASAPNNTSR